MKGRTIIKFENLPKIITDDIPLHDFRIDSFSVDDVVIKRIPVKCLIDKFLCRIICAVNRGIDIHFDREKILWVAAQMGQFKTVQFLILNGADVHAFHDMAIQLAAASGHINIAQYLINSGADPHSLNDNSVYLAIVAGNIEMVKYLISQGGIIDPRWKWGAFCDIVSCGFVEMAKFLVSMGVNIHNEDDKAIILASENGHIEMVKYLVSLGVNIHTQNNRAMELALINHHHNIIEYLKSQ